MHHFYRLPTLLQLVIVAFIGGGIGPFSKVALAVIPPTSFAFIRLMLITAFVAFFLQLSKTKLPTRADIRLFAPLATFWWLTMLLVVVGLRYTTATSGQLIHVSIPIITAVLAFLILHKSLKLRQWLGILVAAVGVSIIILQKGQLHLGDNVLVGNLVLLASAVVYSFYAVLSQSQKYTSIGSSQMILIAAACGTLALLPFAVGEAITTNWTAQLTLPVTGAAFVVGLQSAGFYILFQSLIKSIGPSQATLNIYIIPIFTFAWAFLLLNERLTLPVICGGMLALVGVWIVTKHNQNR